MKSQIVKRVLLGGAALVASSCLAMTGAPQSGDSTTTAKPPDLKLTIDEHPLNREGTLGTSYAPIVKQVAPTVVKVSTTLHPQASAMIPEDSPLRQFFGQLPHGHNMPRQHGLGSGVIVTADGYILTNNHVVDGAEAVKVTLLDGREFTAKVIGADPKSDVAVLKVDAKDLPFIKMANSDQIAVGDIVLAIGNPFGIGQTVTSGIVSALGRATMDLDYEDFIQTDAAINPGNSGGALVDTDGRLIGINTAIISGSGGNQGIGFAIPTDLARGVMENLVKYGKVERGYLGVLIQDVTPELAKEFKLKDTHGALIGDVTPKSPAEKAGLASSDVVTEFNGQPVLDSRHLKLEVGRTMPGTTVTMTVLHNGATKDLKVTLAELPGAEKVASVDKAGEPDTLNGVGVTDLDKQARHELDVPDRINGAVVTEVDADSAAHDAGLQAGDVIEEINHQPIKTADDAVRLTEKPSDRMTLLKVWSKGNSRYLVVDETKAS